MLKISVPLMILALSLACEKEEETVTVVANPTEPFLATSDFSKPAGLTEYPADEFKLVLNENASLFQIEDSYTLALTEEEGAAQDACIEERINAGTFKVEGSKATLAIAYDIASCIGLNQENAEYKIAVKEAKGLIYAESSCDGADLSALEGKTITEVGENMPICKANGSILLNGSINQTMDVTVGDKTVEYKLAVLTAESTPENTPCAISYTAGIAKNSVPCQTFDKDVSSFGENSESDFIQLLTQDLSWETEQDHTWFSSGKMDVIYNNWTGVVSFQGGKVAPTYTFSNGTETVTGSLTGSTFLNSSRQNLKNRAKKAQHKAEQLLRTKLRFR